MTDDAKRAKVSFTGPISAARQQVAKRIRDLDADDEEFRTTKPDSALQHAARQPGLRLPQIL